MFNVNGSELLIILLVALVVLGPQRLPTVARQIGQTLGIVREMARGFQNEIEAAAKTLDIANDPKVLETAEGVKAKKAGSQSSDTDASSSTETESVSELDTGIDKESLAAKAREVDVASEASNAKPASKDAAILQQEIDEGSIHAEGSAGAKGSTDAEGSAGVEGSIGAEGSNSDVSLVQSDAQLENHTETEQMDYGGLDKDRAAQKPQITETGEDLDSSEASSKTSSGNS